MLQRRGALESWRLGRRGERYSPGNRLEDFSAAQGVMGYFLIRLYDFSIEGKLYSSNHSNISYS